MSKVSHAWVHGAAAAPAVLVVLAATAAAAPIGERPPGVATPARPSAAQQEAAARLKAVGLTLNDPKLAGQLKALADGAGTGYVAAHVLSMTPARVGPTRTGSAAPAAGSPAGRAPQAVTRIAPMSVQGSVVAVYDDVGHAISGSPTLSSTSGTHYPGQYSFLVRTAQKVSVQGGPMFSGAGASVALPCTPNNGMILFARAAAADDPNFVGGSGLPVVHASNGSYSYYVQLQLLGDYPLAQPRPGQLSFTFENAVVAPLAVTMQPDVTTATVDITIDHTPALTGNGVLYPWGSTNLAAANATLAGAGAARVGSGNWQTQTAGDDLVGVGVQLGQGWKVTSASIKSAVSGVSPQDLSPDNAWRGASVTTAPQGADLRTAVHWHYSGIDSLDYTIEWQLSGPLGERPLTTMARSGSCDN